MDNVCNGLRLFAQGRVRLVAGGGGFAPFLHKAVLEMNSGEEKEVTIPPEDTFGECERNSPHIGRSLSTISSKLK